MDPGGARVPGAPLRSATGVGAPSGGSLGPLNAPMSLFNTYLKYSGGPRISPRWGRQPWVGGGPPAYHFAKFSQKLHGTERIWIRGGASKILLCTSANEYFIVESPEIFQMTLKEFVGESWIFLQGRLRENSLQNTLMRSTKFWVHIGIAEKFPKSAYGAM